MDTDDVVRRINRQLGLLRSLLIYYALPGRQRRLRRLYRPFIRPGDLCFDIGAHVGSRILAMRRLGARVVAVEPQPQLAAWLRRLYGRDPAVILVSGAVGARSGRQTLHLSSRHPTVSTLSESWIDAVRRDRSFEGVAWDDAVTVPLTTLDALIEKYGRPVFCKIDVEGFELAVVQGLSRPIPALSFEYIPAAMGVTLAVIDRLEALGRYEYDRSTGERSRLSGRWRPAAVMAVELAQLAPADGSGDVYARLDNRPDRPGQG